MDIPACVPTSLISEADAAHLPANSCAQADSLCVPNAFLDSNFVPASCRSLGDGEGRCVAACLVPPGQLNAPIPRLGTLRSDVPADLERILGRALQRDATERFPSAAAMAHELREWAGAHGAAARPAARALFHELFGEDVAKQRRRIGDMLSRLDQNPPISGSVPIQRLDQPTHAGTRGAATNLSSTVGFARRVTSSRDW